MGKREEKNLLAGKLGENRAALAQLAGSAEARQLMELLNQQGGVRQAAKAAAGGDTAALMGMVEQLMKTGEGAALVDRIGARAKEAGLN